jgi:hypothetical protein
MAAGVHTIGDYQEKLPKNGAVSNQTLTIRRQVRSMKEDRLIVEPALAQALEPFSGRLGFLDGVYPERSEGRPSRERCRSGRG